MAPLIPPPRQVKMCDVVNTTLHLNRNGCQSEMLPQDLPPKNTAFKYLAQLRDDGTRGRIVDTVRSQRRS